MGKVAWSVVVGAGLIPATPALAEKPDASHESSIEFGVGLHATCLIPFGHWTDHAMAGTMAPETLHQFGPGAGGGGPGTANGAIIPGEPN